MEKIKLAEALLRRKELQEKVNILSKFKDSSVIYQIRAQRVKVTEGIEELNLDTPKMDAGQVTAEYDHYARALRLLDGAIQQANWTCEIDVDHKCLADYSNK